MHMADQLQMPIISYIIIMYHHIRIFVHVYLRHGVGENFTFTPNVYRYVLLPTTAVITPQELGLFAGGVAP